MLLMYSFGDVSSKIAFLVARMPHNNGDNIPLTHQEIAGMLGTHRETVSRALIKLYQECIIKPDSRGVRIINWSAIRKMAEAA